MSEMYLCLHSSMIDLYNMLPVTVSVLSAVWLSATRARGRLDYLEKLDCLFLTWAEGCTHSAGN
jgi:hypothetical protein